MIRCRMVSFTRKTSIGMQRCYHKALSSSFKWRKKCANRDSGDKRAKNEDKSDRKRKKGGKGTVMNAEDRWREGKYDGREGERWRWR